MELYHQRMSSGAKHSGWLAGLVVAILAVGSARAERETPPAAPQVNPAPAPEAAPAPAADPAPPPSNPYLAIPIRNAFGLLPPPPPVDESAAPPPPPPPPPITVRLTGLTDVLGKKMAMFVFTEQAAAKAAPKPVTMKEGERQDGVEVLAINLANNSVRLSNHGVLTNVTFAKMEGGAAPGPAAQPGPPGYPPRIPGMQPPNMGGGNPNANIPQPPSSNASTIVGGGGGGGVNDAANANGSVIIGGVSDAAPRLGSKGSINSVGGGASSPAPSYGGNNGSPVYSTPGSGIISSGAGAGGTPNRPTRTAVPRYEVPKVDWPTPPGGGSTTPQ